MQKYQVEIWVEVEAINDYQAWKKAKAIVKRNKSEHLASRIKVRKREE